MTYLFSGSVYYKYVNMNLLSYGSIENDWGLPSDLDAVFQFSEYGKIYAIKGRQYYTINRVGAKPTGGPRPLSDWGQRLTTVDAAFMATNGANMRDTIFFSGDHYYTINTRTRRVRMDNM